MKKTILLFTVTFAMMMCLVKTGCAQSAKYYFEPSVSVIEGTIREKIFYDEAFERNESRMVIRLDRPINVYAQKDDDLCSNVYGISEIQLMNTSDRPMNFTAYNGKRVRLSGTFSCAITAHHYTRVLMDVSKIQRK